jgi:hypothetical protein
MVWYELAHDRFVRPIRSDNRRWTRENGTLLRTRADLWHEQNRPETGLLNGDELQSVQRMLDGSHAELNPVEQEFLSRSKQHVARKTRAVRRKANLAAAVVTVTVLVLGLGAAEWRSNWWDAAWLVLDLQKELQSRTYGEVPRQIAPLSSIPILPRDEVLPRPSHPATFGAEDRAGQRNTARQRTEAELARGANAGRGGYRIVLPAGVPSEASRVLAQLGYRVEARGSATGPANSMTFADDVPLQEVRTIALAYMGSGAEIVRIRRFRTEGHSREVAFDFDADVIDWPAYTVRQLESLRAWPYPNDVKPEPAGSE